MISQCTAQLDSIPDGDSMVWSFNILWRRRSLSISYTLQVAGETATILDQSVIYYAWPDQTNFANHW